MRAIHQSGGHITRFPLSLYIVRWIRVERKMEETGRMKISEECSCVRRYSYSEVEFLICWIMA